MGSLTRRTYLRAGFVLALCVRLLTAALVILVPLFAVDALGATSAEAGLYVLALWVGNAAGVAVAVLILRNQSLSSFIGFIVVGLSMLGLALGGHAIAIALVLTAGVGVGLPQPFLPAFMHSDSHPSRPFAGLGVYSTALGIGLVLGPLIAFGAFPFYGFSGDFAALLLVSLVGAAGAVSGDRSMEGRPRPPAPSPSAWRMSFESSGFGRAVLVNLLYSLLLPVFLSYGAIYSEERFGFSAASALLLFTTVFTLSVCFRFAAVRAESRLRTVLAVSSIMLLFSTLMVGLAPSWPYLVFGMLLFSVPHAFIFPIANYLALTKAGADVMNASYVFQASSAVAEFITPAAAVLLIPWGGLEGLFLIGGVVAAVNLFVVAGSL